MLSSTFRNGKVWLNRLFTVTIQSLMDDETEGVNIVEGRVTETLPSTLFRVAFPDGKELISYLGGRMRVHKIKVLVGDRVMVQIDPYGGKGRIVKRL